VEGEVMRTCKIVAEITVDGKVMKSKTWPAYDVMKMSATRGWVRRHFNSYLKDFAVCLIGQDKIIRANWTAYYGPPDHSIVRGELSGLNGTVRQQRGVFEP
jgi:hypothetical protein